MKDCKLTKRRFANPLAQNRQFSMYDSEDFFVVSLEFNYILKFKFGTSAYVYVNCGDGIVQTLVAATRNSIRTNTYQ